MRTQPYTEIGIRRLRCFRFAVCGNKAVHQWQICADDRVYRPICQECDIELNRIVLEWMGFPDAAEKLVRYIAKIEEEAVPRKSYPTPEDAMRASLADGNTPCLRESVVRRKKLDVDAIALALGCKVEKVGAVYRFTKGD